MSEIAEKRRFWGLDKKIRRARRAGSEWREQASSHAQRQEVAWIFRPKATDLVMCITVSCNKRAHNWAAFEQQCSQSGEHGKAYAQLCGRQ